MATVASRSIPQSAPAKARAFRLTFDVEVYGEMDSCDITKYSLHHEPIPERVPLQRRWSVERWMMALAYDLAEVFDGADVNNLPAHITGARIDVGDISVQRLSADEVGRLSASRKRRLEKALDMALDEFGAREAALKQRRH